MKIDTDLVRKKEFATSIKSSHSKLSREFKALAILRYLYPQRFENMAKGESPDFQDTINDMGIEVTDAVKENDMLVSRTFPDLCQGDAENEEMCIKKIEKNGYSILPIKKNRFRIITTGTADGEKLFFQRIIRKKIKKLEDYKKKFKKIGLAIMLPEIPTSYAEDHFLEWTKEILNEDKSFFDFVYVLSHRFCIYYETQQNLSEKKPLKSEEYIALSKIARMTAEGELSLTDPEWL